MALCFHQYSMSAIRADTKRVLFLCTGNCCRSQMAEGLLRSLANDGMEALSAGARPAGYIHPLAIEVMQDTGIDISVQRSKSIYEFLPAAGQPPDLIISVCSAADHDCPTFPAHVQRLHWPFDDPAQADGSHDQKLAVFRKIRDEIRRAIVEYFR